VHSRRGIAFCNVDELMRSAQRHGFDDGSLLIKVDSSVDRVAPEAAVPSVLTGIRRSGNGR